jgi:hypothetical protein
MVVQKVVKTHFDGCLRGSIPKCGALGSIREVGGDLDEELDASDEVEEYSDVVDSESELSACETLFWRATDNWRVAVLSETFFLGDLSSPEILFRFRD